MTEELRALARMEAEVRRLRRRLWGCLLSWTFAGVAGLVVLMSLLPPGLASGRGSPVPLILDGTLLVVAGLAAALVGRQVRALHSRTLSDEVDEASNLGSGEVRAAFEFLEEAGPRGSRRLIALHLQRVSKAVGSVRGSGLFPRTGPRWRRRAGRALGAAGAAGLLLAVGLSLRPGPTISGAAALGSAWQIAFPEPLPPILVESGGSDVGRGRSLRVRIRASGRSAVDLWWQAPGERPSSRRVDLRPRSFTPSRIGPIMARTRYWVTDSRGVSSDTFVANPREPLLVNRLKLRVSYPAYVRRSPEEFERPLPPLLLPEGARLELEGTANYPLRAGELRYAPPAGGRGASGVTRAGGEEKRPLALDGQRFHLSFRPRRSGSWVWRLEGAQRFGDPLVPEPIRIVVLADSVPSVRVLYPGRDAAASPEGVLPLVIEARDDLGLAEVDLVTWRRSPPGRQGGRRSRRIDSGASDRRQVLRPVLDLGADGLLPGDTLYYRVEAHDRNPTHRPAVSEAFRVHLLSPGERDDARARASESLVSEAKRLSRVAAALEREVRETERHGEMEADRADGGQAAGHAATGTSGDAGFAATEEGRRMLDQAARLVDSLAAMSDRIAGLREDLARSLSGDPELESRLEQLERLYEELGQAGLRETVKRLARALGDLDAAALERQLGRLGADAAELKKRLERSVGLLERTAMRQALMAARSRAEELAADQATAADAREDSDEWARREEAMAERTDAFARNLRRLEERLRRSETGTAGDSTRVATQRASLAARGMRRSAGEARKAMGSGPPGPDASSVGAPGPAKRATGGVSGSGEARAMGPAHQAATDLHRAAGALTSAARNMGENGSRVAAAALARARLEAVELAREESSLLDRLHGPEALRGLEWEGRQIAVRQGLDNLRRSLGEAGRRTPLVDRETDAAADRISVSLDRLLREMERSGGLRLPSRRQGEEVVQALDDLALRLFRRERRLRDSRSSRPQTARAAMAALARQQRGISQRTGGLLALGEVGRRVDEGLRQVAGDERRISEALEKLESRDVLGSPAQLAREAREIAERLAAGRLDRETVERQRGLFRRMLDAGRSLEQDEVDPNRRESRAGVAVAHEVGPLDPEVLVGPRFAHPDEAELQALPARYRLMVLDYFDRLGARAGVAGRRP
ncbi:MAG: hypothetical protein ACE5HQ_05525 [Gemmatimonadota bacterium]